MGSKQVLKIIFKSIISNILPNHCILCGDILQGKSQSVCVDCANTLPYRHKDAYLYCEHCGRVCLENEKCGCEKETFYFDKVVSLTHYHEKIETMISEMKFNQRKSVCFDFASLMTAYYKDYILSHSVIIPVPLGKKRLRERGYNQSFLIARSIGSRLNIKVLDKLVLRCKETKKLSQSSGIDERKNIIENAFSLNKNIIREIENKNILVIDDVFTTGATVNELCKTIKLNTKVKNIDILTAGHT